MSTHGPFGTERAMPPAQLSAVVAVQCSGELLTARERGRAICMRARWRRQNAPPPPPQAAAARPVTAAPCGLFIQCPPHCDDPASERFFERRKGMHDALCEDQSFFWQAPEQ